MTDNQQHGQAEIVHGMAVHLVGLIHLSMDWDVWGRRRLKYWEILQNNIAVAAYTDKLSRWLSNICNSMQIPKAGRNDEERRMIHAIITSGYDRQILRHLREEPHYVCVEVQVNRQEIREAQAEGDTTENTTDAIDKNQLGLSFE